MKVTYEDVGLGQIGDWREVVNWVYNQHGPVGEPDPFRTGEKRYLARVDGEAAAACRIFDYTMARKDVDFSCGGVASVATLVPYRATGVAGGLMRETLRRMRENGQVLAALYAFKESYYRRFGYEFCGWRWQIKCPQHRMPDLRCDLPARRVDPAEVASLASVYTPFIRGFSGSNLRTEEDWRDRMGLRPPVIYAIGEPAEAYFWASMEAFWGEASIGEIAWSTARGYRNALALMRSLASNQSTLVWNEPPESPFLATYLDQGVVPTMSRASMFRVLDVPGALRRLRSAVAGSFTMLVADAELPENAGPWRVSFSADGTSVEPAQEANLRMHIGPFTQALMGSPSLRECAAHGLVEVLSLAELEAACRLLDPVQVVCMDFF